MKTTLFSKNRDEKNYELFFESDELHRVQYLLETKQFGELSELQSSEDEDTGIKLKLSLAERGKLVKICPGSAKNHLWLGKRSDPAGCRYAFALMRNI